MTPNREANKEVRVDYVTVDGTAVAGRDYEPKSGTLVFGRRDLTKTIWMPVEFDAAYEDTETMTLRLSNPRGGVWLANDNSPTRIARRLQGHQGDSRRSTPRCGAMPRRSDDDPQARRYIRNTLSEAGFTPVLTGNPDEVERLVEAEKPHLVLVDLMSPWADGFELMERIDRISDAPVIFLSRQGIGQDMDRGFELGAADYVVKPFTPTELVARIRAALRKRAAPGQTGQLEPFLLGDLAIDYAERFVTVAGRKVHLTATEYKLLFELSTAAERVLTHEQLLRKVWGPIYSGDAQIVYTYVKQLRNKLEDNARRPTYIFTEPRVGYRMAMPATVWPFPE